MQAAIERKLYLIDAIGPFFRHLRGKKRRINWSKINWEQIETRDPVLRRKQFDRIRADFRRFVQRAVEVGYNAISLDDLPHLADHPHYEPEIRERIAVLREEFAALYAIAAGLGADVYLTTDIISYTPALLEKVGTGETEVNRFLAELIDEFFGSTPGVAGLILRIGESDGLDVKGDFQSRLHLKNPAMVNRCLRELLPIFEKHERLAIFRTWTVGAHRVGDLIWHRATLRRTLDAINSPALVLSMKFGESDFFRHLDLNRNFFRTSIPKIIELQTRREYEGCGEYPSFVGWDYERFARELHEAENVIGISVWCQTGGWLPFRRLAFLEPEAVWTDINTIVTLRLFRHGESVEQALRACPGCTPANEASWLELMRLSDEAVKELLYLPEFARQSLYFRRVRIPPLTGVYWHNIFVNHALRKIVRRVVADPENCLRSAHAALEKIERMKHLAAESGLPVADIEFMADTFRLFVLAREYYLLPYSEDRSTKLKTAGAQYKKRYPKKLRPRYRLRLDFKPFRLRGRYLHWAIQALVRRKAGYRVIDRILSLHLLALGYRIVRKARPKLIPKFARKSAMGIDAIFR